jgi:excisionase family DNA binding protein
MTTDDVAAMAGVSARTVREWERRGHLPAIRVGKRYVRYRLPDVERLLAVDGKG